MVLRNGLASRHPRRVLLKVIFFWMSSERGGRDKPTKIAT